MRKHLFPKVPTGPYSSLTSINSLKSISESDTEVKEILCVTSLALISVKGVRPAQSALLLDLGVRKLPPKYMESI